MTTERIPVSLVVLTFNEELNLDACLAGVGDLVAQLLVVDSGSTDGTRDIAAKYGATVVDHPFADHRSQWTWAINNLPIACDWVLGLDADQQVTPELATELRRLFAGGARGTLGLNGFFVKRRQIFRGRWIRHGGYYPKYLMKLFRRQVVYFDERDLLDHHFYVPGPVGKLEHDIVEDNQNERDIAFWIDKHNRYAVKHAREEYLRRTQTGSWALRPHLLGNPDQRTMWLKERWYQMPLFVRPVLYFFYRFVLRRGFLDGKEGFIFHFLQGFWYRLLVDVHLDEMLRADSGDLSCVKTVHGPAPAGEGRTR